ncbi:putative pre-mrna-splicing factor 38b [Diplocarpon rosae]|nr:putative pre-mrna-splicing factor 38b [Diplocarpon rosae]
MANDELSDDHVAGLLARDAKESSIKYSSLGLEAFNRSKPPTNKPKPNTRFLRNIIKDTDSHNAALLAKEAAESRARLQGLATANQPRAKPAGSDIRRRQLGDIAAILGGRSTKRKRESRGQRESRRVNTSSEDEAEPLEKSRAKRSRNRGEREERGYESQRRQRSVSIERDKYREGRKYISRSRSPREHRNKGKDKEIRIRHRSPKRDRSRSSETEKSSERYHRLFEHRRPPSPRRRDAKAEAESKPDYDSDPLDSIIGPRPPPVPEVKRKGRGTMSHASGIDSRFSSNYDPTADVQLDFDEENDWDQALEALRDRTKWKQQGADRLRAAGFTEDEVSKWEKGGEKREEDVKWSKKGEGREWDRGKVIDDSGAVSIEPKFGRLKDS